MTTFNDLLTFTRNSPAWAYDRFGDLSEHAIDAPRLQHDPASVTTSSTTIDFDALVKGDSVLIDLPGSDTFAVGQDISVTDSSDIDRYLTASVEFSSPGSVQVTVKTINGTGTGSSYTLIRNLGLLIEEQRTRLNTIAAAPTSPENVTVTATAHTISFFGTGTIELTGVATETLVGTGAGGRVTLTFTPTAGTLTITPSGTVADLQLEEGDFATSVIRGEGSQVTREADDCSRTLGAEFNPNEGTWLVKFRPLFPKSDGFVTVFGDDAPTSATRQFQINRSESGGNISATVFDSGGNDITAQVDMDSADVFTAGVSFSENGCSSSVNGLATSSLTGANPSRNQIVLANPKWTHLGKENTHVVFEKVYYIPRALSAAELEALTAPEQ